jgi:putative transposase
MPHARKDLIAWVPGQFYHLYNRGTRYGLIFREPANYSFVTDRIQEYAAKFAISMIAYCLMPTHYHLLARQDGDQPAGLLPQYVFNSYTKAYNKRYEQSGTLFEHRYQAKVIKASSHLLHLCRYIHANPVKDGLAADPGDWPFSNYLECIGEREGALVDQEFIHDQFGSKSEYRSFVFDYLERRSLPEDLQWYLNSLEQ